MSTNDFNPGWLRFESGKYDVNQDIDIWLNKGYLAFSNKEKQYDPNYDSVLLKQTLASSTNSFTGYPGILMEINLWGESPEKGLYSELSIEREANGFFFQWWTLFTQEPDQVIDLDLNCYYQKVNTESQRGPWAGKLESYEVICPKHRLHVFITCGG